jgi:hypothetical protein
VRRIWLLVLVFFLPLQMTWAAVHGYSHDADMAAHSSSVAAEFLAQADPEPHADVAGHGCCSVSHSCHGSPSLVAIALFALAAPSRCVLNPNTRAFKARELVSRHERPQWLPA